MCEVIMNLSSKSCNLCPYGLREIGQNVNCAIIAPPLGQLIYGEIRHDPRTAGLLLLFLFFDLWFMSCRPKHKVRCYSAPIRPIDIILSLLICEVIMNLTSKSCNLCPYGLRGIGQNVKCAVIAPPLGRLI